MKVISIIVLAPVRLKGGLKGIEHVTGRRRDQIRLRRRRIFSVDMHSPWRFTRGFSAYLIDGNNVPCHGAVLYEWRRFKMNFHPFYLPFTAGPDLAICLVNSEDVSKHIIIRIDGKAGSENGLERIYGRTIGRSNLRGSCRTTVLRVCLEPKGRHPCCFGIRQVDPGPPPVPTVFVEGFWRHRPTRIFTV